MTSSNPQLGALADSRLWVAWQEEERETKDGTKHRTKVPYSATGRPGRASSTDPETWGTLEQARARAERLPQPFGRGGVGINLADLGGGFALSGIDLDSCRDPQTGTLEPWALEVIARFDTYTEVSPSERGAKVFFLLALDDLGELRAGLGSDGKKWSRGDGKSHPPAIELYLARRYFTVTGQRLEIASKEPRIVDADTVRWLIRKAGPAFVGNGHDPATPAQDNSRSAIAYRKGTALVREGATFDEMCAALCADPETADWSREKGDAAGGRELRRIWDKASAITADDRPVVRIAGGSLAASVDEAEAILVENDKGLYQRGDFIVRPAYEQVPIADERETLGLRLVQVGPHHMVERFNRAIDFQRFDQRSKKFVSINPPHDVALSYLARIGLSKVPVLIGITNSPTLRRDGSILDTPGYDATTGILYDPGSAAFPPVPVSPARDEANAALEVLRELIAEFPFVGSGSRSVALSAILTATIRRTLDHAPLHAFDSPVAGSGKSKLVDLASMIATGHEAPVIASSKSDEELEKRLGSCLLAGDTLVSFDNCEHPLGGALLNQVLTQKMVKIRILGKSETPTMPSNAMLAATGNNLVIAGDVTRRAIICRLDPEAERPELRTFKNPIDPVERIRSDRPRYVLAALTVLRAYVVADRPESGLVALGGFEDWSRWVRDALVWLGEDDPVKTQEDLRAVDPIVEQMEAVLRCWAEVLGHAPTTTSEMIKRATTRTGDYDLFLYPQFREALLGVAGNGGSVINARALGVWIGRIKDRIVGGRRVVRCGITDGAVRWQLERVDLVRTTVLDDLTLVATLSTAVRPRA